MTKKPTKKPPIKPVKDTMTPMENQIAILTEQIDRIVQMKPGLQTKSFKAIKNHLMKYLK